MHPLGILQATSPDSAAVVAPILNSLVAPTSVLDVGCGTGAWTDAFNCETLGVDELDAVPIENYQRLNLHAPFHVGRFDLAICLEVGEHLPAEVAPTLVESLVRAAPVVAFSAAIPGQDGYGHINLQWPEWWADLFDAFGYRQFDSVRHKIWDDDRVAWWYRQNLFLYSARDFPEQRLPRHAVHPGFLEDRLRLIPPSAHGVPELVRALPTAVSRALRRRF